MKGTDVTGAFAAEQSFAAAQLLTNDQITLGEALELSHEKHLSSSLGNAELLPIAVTDELRTLGADYLQAKERGIKRDGALGMASELLAARRQMAALLKPETSWRFGDLHGRWQVEVSKTAQLPAS